VSATLPISILRCEIWFTIRPTFFPIREISLYALAARTVHTTILALS
jgi:hypothetical protein